ncbi:MAG TPA: DUF6311 domain-containing protein, partial [Acetobacteraceae bacterium]|nr:DUF6311 domain-containing protein [Acetobacteraceae bacterium]
MPRYLSLTSLAGALAAVLTGIATVLLVFGTHVVPPWNTGWMLSGQIGPDPVQYWLGWQFFRRAPWSWPPGLNPLWGLEVSSSIFYADSIPLFAFLFKALSPLGEVSQYWGLWLVSCGALQGLFGWLLLGRVTRDPLARLAGAALFVVQPTLLNRMGGHFALSAHFLILAGLLLCLVPGAGWRRVLAWAALVLGASLIHSYILPMVLGLWAADWLRRSWRRAQPRMLSATETPLVPAAGLLGLWLSGFFALRGGWGGEGARYGEMQLDLLAPFDPAVWGWLLPDLPDPNHLESGGSYAGLGILLLLAIAVLAWMRRPLRGLTQHWPLLLALFGMLAIAITHRPSIGGWQVTLIPMPDAFEDLAAALRASERFLWPLAYALLVAAVATVAHAFGGRRAGLILAALLVVQVVDLGPGFARARHFFPRDVPAQVPLRLGDPFWTEAARHYTRVRLVPNGNQARWWEEVAV